MNNKASILTAAIAVALIGTASPSTASAAQYRVAANPIDQQYIVVLKKEYGRLATERTNGSPAVRQVADDMGRTYRATVIQSYDHVLRGFAVRMSDTALQSMLKDPRVDYIEEDGIAHANATVTQANVKSWGLDRVDQRSLLVNTTYNYTTTASKVHAYVIDTGIYSAHSEFTGRVGAGISFVSDGQGTNDVNGHGTHVAGTLGGKLYGVAKGVTIHPVRVLDKNGQGSASTIIAGMNWVAQHRISPAVANLSLGFPDVESAVDTAVAGLTTAGVTVVVAAGNSNSNVCTSPAHAPSAIVVGSTRENVGDAKDERSSFSNFGSCVTLFAPGSSITSAYIGSSNNTAVLSGTSMASPHVAGAAALYLDTNPNSSPTQVKNALIGTSTLGAVLAAGTGSPNRLLYTLTGSMTASGATTAPVITAHECSGSGNRFECSVTYTNPAGESAAVLWPDDTKRTGKYMGTCVIGYTPVPNGRNTATVTIPVTVGNRSFTVSASTTFTCYLDTKIQ